ncbi:MAG: AtpZ/AtpI family protein [Clostridia bacterium]|nr:AtpZ/AtpI family protein [Clostridia bacterium]MDY5555421.1 AtpZ/AtpI family protein [Blautia sp.]
MKRWSEILRNITMLSQLGLSFITPLLLCLAVCWLISSRTGVGGWIYIAGFFFGLGGSGMVAYKFYLSVNRREKKENTDRKKTVSFNRHS